MNIKHKKTMKNSIKKNMNIDIRKNIKIMFKKYEYKG